MPRHALRPDSIGRFLGLLLLAVAGTALPEPAFGQPAKVGPTTRRAALPEAVTPEQLYRIIADLGAGSYETRRAAGVQIKNLPAEAYEVIGNRFNPEDLGPEIEIPLKRAMEVLRIRYVKHKRMKDSLAWGKGQALEAYDRAGARDPRWDDAARAALATLGDQRNGEEAANLAEKVAAFKKAADAGCTDPLVLNYYATFQMDRIRRDNGLAGRREIGQDPWDTPSPKEAQQNTAELDPGTVTRMRGAAEAMRPSGYPARFKCLTWQTYARVLLLTGGDRGEAKKYLMASLDLLPEAIKTPGIPPDRQQWLVLSQHRLEVQLDPKGGWESAFKRLYPLYAAAAGPDSVGPLVFKAEVYEFWAWAPIERRPGGNAATDEEWEQWEQRMAVAREALEAAWRLDPTDWVGPAKMITLTSVRHGRERRDDVEKWFERAMATDPDNADACEAKLKYLHPQRYGTLEEMLAFGRECMETENYRGGVAFMLAQAHLMLADELGDPQSYLRRPNVWADVRDTYEGCLKVFPDSTHERSVYARLAYTAGRYAEARKLSGELGERADLGAWGGQDQYDYFRLQAARKALAAERGEPAERPGVDERVAKALEKAVAAGEQTQDPDVRLRAYADALRPVAPHFQEVAVGTEPRKPAWTKVTLNRAGKAMDCIRFRTPKDRPRDLRLVMIIPKGRENYWHSHRARPGAWYMMPVKGSVWMPSLGVFWHYQASDLPQAPSPGGGGWHEIMFQQREAAEFTPDTEYLIWFRFADTEPVRMNIGITFVPAGEEPASWARTLNDLGF